MSPETSWHERIPKVELHVHLEGAFSLEVLWELMGKYGGDADVPDFDALRRRFVYTDFPHFIDTWVWKNGFIREYDDFARIAESAARRLAAQNVVYAEVFYSPPDFFRRGMTVGEITAAVRRGLERVPEVDVALVADLVRDFGPELAVTTLHALREVKDLGVVGVGLGGSEQHYPPELFENAFEQARNSGFHTTVHAGEAAGPESVWNAVRKLRADRIGHGTRAVDDERLVDFLAERRIPVEACPLSNLRTGVISEVQEHPIRRFFDRGVLATVNTDDPMMFGNTLADELGALEGFLGFSRLELKALMLNAVNCSWKPEPDKEMLRRRITEDPSLR